MIKTTCTFEQPLNYQPLDCACQVSLVQTNQEVVFGCEIMVCCHLQLLTDCTKKAWINKVSQLPVEER